MAYFQYLDIVSRKTTDLDRVELLNKTLEELETSFLKEDSFICGSDITIADLCLSVITSTLEAVNHDLTDFPRTVLHSRKCKEQIQGWEEVGLSVKNDSRNFTFPVLSVHLFGLKDTDIGIELLLKQVRVVVSCRACSRENVFI